MIVAKSEKVALTYGRVTPFTVRVVSEAVPKALVTEDWATAEPTFEEIGVEPAVGAMLGTLVIVDGIMLGGVIEAPAEPPLEEIGVEPAVGTMLGTLVIVDGINMLEGVIEGALAFGTGKIVGGASSGTPDDF